MKLNYKRTIFVGFAFFLISAFWQAYDNVIPLILTNKFGLSQAWSGVIMALDNILALFMLPLFGALSDKVDTRLGKRTPCAETNLCADCDSPDRICKVTAIFERPPTHTPTKVLLVDEDLGY